MLQKLSRGLFCTFLLAVLINRWWFTYLGKTERGTIGTA